MVRGSSGGDVRANGGTKLTLGNVALSRLRGRPIYSSYLAGDYRATGVGRVFTGLENAQERSTGLTAVEKKLHKFIVEFCGRQSGKIMSDCRSGPRAAF